MPLMGLRQFKVWCQRMGFQTQQCGLGGFNQAPDKLDREILLANPCDMTDASVYLTSTRYLVVKEA